MGLQQGDREQDILQQIGGVSVRDLSPKRSGVRGEPTWGLPEPTHPSVSLAAADGSTSTNDSPSSEGE